MGNIYTRLPDEIFLHIINFLGDKLVIKCSMIDRRLYNISRDNLLWKIRTCNRFKHITSTPDNDVFYYYTNLHVLNFFNKNLTHELDFMIRSYIEINRNYIKEIIISNKKINLVRYISRPTSNIIKLSTHIEPNKKGKKQEILYNIKPNVSFIYDIYKKCCYKKTSKTKTKLSINDTLCEIIRFFHNGYFIVKKSISRTIANKLLNTGIAIK